MYRIEVAPGEETVFRTIEELAVGVRNGVITPRSRIYHHASEKWLPIGLHPHYKKALEMPAPSSSSAPVTNSTPLPAAPRKPPAHAPEPRITPDPKLAREPKVVFEPKSAPTIPPPVSSPIIAMQKEILRDLPLLSIPEPEPLPWEAPAAQPAPALEPSPVRLRESAPVRQEPPPVRMHEPAPVRQEPPPVRMHEPPVATVVAPRPPVVHAPAPKPSPTAAYTALEYEAPPAEPIASAEEEMHERPTARRSRRVGGKPFVLLGTAAALVVGAQLVLTATPSASSNPVATPATAPAAEVESDPTDRPAGVDASQVTSAPARVPMTPGPAFAGSAPLRPGDSVAAPAAKTPAPAAAPAPVEITPAPVAVDLAMPELPADSLAPTARTTDTLGMKKLLRALNGAKPAEAPATP